MNAEERARLRKLYELVRHVVFSGVFASQLYGLIVAVPALLDALEAAEARAERLEKALTKVRPVIAAMSAPSEMYGWFPGGDYDPRDFKPDEENEPDELSAHRAACEAWDRGECPRVNQSGRIETFSVPEHKSKSGETIEAHEATAIVCGSKFGMGVYECRDDDMCAMLAEIDAALAAADKKEPTNV